MNIIDTIIEGIKRIFSWFAVGIVTLGLSIFIGNILHNGWLGFLIFLISIPLIIVCRRVYKGWGSKCPNCKKLNGLMKEKTDVANQKEIHVPVEINHRNLDGKVTGTHEQYVPGKRITYKDTYKCKFCSNSYTRTRTVDKANI